MTQETTQPPASNYTAPEYVEPEPVTAFINWVLGQPFKDSIAKINNCQVAGVACMMVARDRSSSSINLVPSAATSRLTITKRL